MTINYIISNPLRIRTDSPPNQLCKLENGMLEKSESTQNKPISIISREPCKVMSVSGFGADDNIRCPQQTKPFMNPSTPLGVTQ